jgi:HAD superfamily phosphatase (TIGR01668 family)
MLTFLTPHLYLNSVLDLDAVCLDALGVEGLLLDVDGTLKDFRAETLPEPVLAWVGGLRARGVRLCLVSNGKTRRIERLARLLDVPFVAGALKPLPWGCRQAVRQMGLEGRRVAMVGDQIFADVLAGRLAGMLTVLVPPTHADEPWFTRVKRPLERYLVRRFTRKAFLAGGSGQPSRPSAPRRPPEPAASNLAVEGPIAPPSTPRTTRRASS